MRRKDCGFGLGRRKCKRIHWQSAVAGACSWHGGLIKCTVHEGMIPSVEDEAIPNTNSRQIRTIFCRVLCQTTWSGMKPFFNILLLYHVSPGGTHSVPGVLKWIQWCWNDLKYNMFPWCHSQCSVVGMVLCPMCSWTRSLMRYQVRRQQSGPSASGCGNMTTYWRHGWNCRTFPKSVTAKHAN